MQGGRHRCVASGKHRGCGAAAKCAGDTQESERIYSDERLSQRLSKSFKVFDGSAKSFPSRVCHASCCLGGLGHSDNSGTDPKHPRKCRFCTKVLPDDAVVAR